jgi:hypothetical protein
MVRSAEVRDARLTMQGILLGGMSLVTFSSFEGVGFPDSDRI